MNLVKIFEFSKKFLNLHSKSILRDKQMRHFWWFFQHSKCECARFTRLITDTIPDWKMSIIEELEKKNKKVSSSQSCDFFDSLTFCFLHQNFFSYHYNRCNTQCMKIPKNCLAFEFSLSIMFNALFEFSRQKRDTIIMQTFLPILIFGAKFF